MNAYNVPPQPNAAVVVIHDARAVRDIAVFAPAAYVSDGPPWIAAAITPGPNSGKATTPGAYVRSDTGQVVAPPKAGTVLMKQGVWQAVAGGQGGAAYAWNEPLAPKQKPGPEDRYSPFISGGTVLFRPTPEVKKLEDLGTVTLLFSDWAQHVAPALALFESSPGLFKRDGDPEAQRQLLGLLARDNRLLAVMALRGLQGTKALTAENEHVYLNRAAGHFAAVVLYVMLAGPGAGSATAAEAVKAVSDTRDPAQIRALALGAFAATIFGDAESFPRARAVLEATYRQAGAVGLRAGSDPYLYAIYRNAGLM
jgi:hypothetical protein